MPKTRTTALVLTALGVAALAVASPATAERSRGAPFPRSVERRLELVAERPETLGVPGSIVAVDVPGRGSFTSVRGYASLRPEQELTEDTHFRVGSITKTFTATVVLQLVQEGKLDLDDKVGEYVPDAPNADVATIRDLLAMTSGIYDEGGSGSLLSEATTKDPSRCFRPEEIVAMAAQEGPGAPVGTFYYSDTNYVLLGMIVEQITGRPFGEELEERIFVPLALENTVYPDLCSTAMPEPAAGGYLVDVTKVSGRDGPRYKRVPYPSPTPSAYGPAGAIISTVGDLKVWARALARGELLDRPVQRERIPKESSPVVAVFTPLAGVDLPVTRGLPVRYGLGTADAGGFVGHNGEVDGYLAELWHEPSTGATIVVLLNATMIADGTSIDLADDMFVSAAEIVVPRAVQTTNV